MATVHPNADVGLLVLTMPSLETKVLVTLLVTSLIDYRYDIAFHFSQLCLTCEQESKLPQLLCPITLDQAKRLRR